jgi:hypothetical protein
MSLALLDRAQQRLPDANEWGGSRGLDAATRKLASSRSGVRLRARGDCTLDRLITDRWQQLAGGETVRCPVCDGPMESRGHEFGADVRGCEPGAVCGCCLDCGATLG